VSESLPPPRWWSPVGATDLQTWGQIPDVGQIIGWRSREAWRVLEVTDRSRSQWDEQTVAAWEKAGSPDPETWAGRERMLLAEPARHPAPNGKDRRGLLLFAWARHVQWWPLSDPYPTCTDCGLLWTCPCYDRNKAAEAAMKELERLGGVLPGCCWACSEPITAAHKSIVFDGENLALPGAAPAVFHTAASRKSHRGTCRSEAIDYERLWVAAQPGRPVRLVCPGVLFRHLSDSECTTGDACPGVDANHSQHAYCTTGVFDSIGGEVTADYRPARNCGTKGCRGPKVRAEVNVAPIDHKSGAEEPEINA
jgi:hypothetical protein